MNTQLIPVFAGQIQGQSIQLVDARLLHSFLEVVTRFNDWIKTRIEEYSFVESQDFLVTENSVTKPEGRGGNRKAVIDYHLTLDMAKELSMVERNEKGKQARRYFIDCERRLLEAHHQPTYEKITDKQKQELYRAAQNVCEKFYWMRDSSAQQWVINGVRVIFNLSDLADLPATQFDLVLTHINSKEAAIDEFRNAVHEMREEFYKTVLSGSAPWTPSLKSKHTQAYKQKLIGQVNWQEVQQKLLGS